MGRECRQCLQGVLLSLAELVVLVTNAGPTLHAPRRGSAAICSQQKKSPQRTGGIHVYFSSRAKGSVAMTMAQTRNLGEGTGQEARSANDRFHASVDVACGDVQANHARGVRASKRPACQGNCCSAIAGHRTTSVGINGNFSHFRGLAHGAFLGDAKEFTHGGRGRSSAACPQVLRQSDSRQQPHHGNHDHQFDQGEASAGAGHTASAQGAEQFKLGFGVHGVFGGR